MKQMSRGLYRLIVLFFLIIMAGLFISSLISTVVLSEFRQTLEDGTQEVVLNHSYYLADYPLVHFLLFSVLSILAFCAGKHRLRGITDGSCGWKISSLCLAAAVGAVMIIAASSAPRFDQARVVEIAEAFTRQDYSAAGTGGYLNYSPYQIGIVRYYYFLSLLFGPGRFIAFQWADLVLMLAADYFLLNTAEKLMPDISGIIVPVLLAFFLPWHFHAVYLYGNTTGTSLLIISLLFFFRYIRRPSIADGLLSSVFMALCCAMKSNFYIFLIAEMLVITSVMLEAMVSRDGRTWLKYALGIILTLLMVLIVRSFNYSCLRKIRGGVPPEGMPAVGWIAMGLQDNHSAPGWYNAYVDKLFAMHQYDAEATKQAALQDIVKYLSFYRNNPRTAVGFFTRKIQSQWNNPTFGMFYMLNPYSGAQWIHSPVFQRILSALMNCFQTLLYGFSLFEAWVLLKKKNFSTGEFFVMTAFIGGFLFQLMWEGNCINTVPFVLLLIIPAAAGIMNYLRVLAGADARRLWRILLLTALFAAVLTAACRLEFFWKLFGRRDDTGSFILF